jgi:hypothetical protein
MNHIGADTTPMAKNEPHRCRHHADGEHRRYIWE